MPAYPLGRIVHHDPRSRAYAYRADAATLVSVRHASHIGILDQGRIGSCTGNATVAALACDPLYSAVGTSDQPVTLDEALAVRIYSLATSLDGFDGTYPPTDTGSSGLAAAKAAQQMGLLSGYQHAFNVAAALAALQSGPVITGIDWYESFFSPSTAGLVAIQPGDTIAGSHEVVGDEYDARHQLVWCRNSWTDQWGVRGRFCLSVSTWAQLLSRDGDATILTPAAQPAPVPIPTPAVDADAALWAGTRAWAGARHTGSNARAARAVTSWAQAKNL